MSSQLRSVWERCGGAGGRGRGLAAALSCLGCRGGEKIWPSPASSGPPAALARPGPCPCTSPHALPPPDTHFVSPDPHNQTRAAGGPGLVMAEAVLDMHEVFHELPEQLAALQVGLGEAGQGEAGGGGGRRGRGIPDPSV